MKEFKNTTIFSSRLNLVSEEKDQYLAMASLMDVADFIPDIDTEKNIDYCRLLLMLLLLELIKMTTFWTARLPF